MTSDPKLIIETPEQTSLEFPLAGIGSRFIAVAMDTIIQSGLTALGVVAYVLSFGAPLIGQNGSIWLMAVLVLFGFVLYYGYFAIFEAIWNGQTPGKRYAKVRVIKDSGRSITVFEAITRNLLRLVDQLPGFYAIGILSAFISSQNKRLGDYAAGTVVVHERPFSEMQIAWDASATAETAAWAYNTTRLSAEDVQLIEIFLQRRTHFADDVRRQTAKQICDRMTAKLGLPREEVRSEEEFLEAVARGRRSVAFK